MEQKWIQFKNIVTSDCEFRFDKGWDILVEDVLFSIKMYLAHKPELAKYCKVHCIKEKFGTLRIYCTKTDAYIDGIIAHAYAISEHTCELCGSSKGKLRKGGYVQVVCDKCFPNWEYKE